MEDFAVYVASLPADVAAAGLCKVVPPADWPGPRGRAPPETTVLLAPSVQHVEGSGGVYRVINEQRHRLTFGRFERRESAAATRELGRAYLQDSAMAGLEQRFWRDLASARPPMCAVDQEGSLFQSAGDLPGRAWNLRALPDLLREDPRADSAQAASVTGSSLSYGAWRTMSSLQLEDSDLYAIHYLHVGAPKRWFGAPARVAGLVEMIAATLFPEDFASCKQFLRHQCHMLSPEVLMANGVPLASLTQREGEFVVTLPRAYHCNFSFGLNIVEKANFALPPWLIYGVDASRCTCGARRDAAHVDAAPFMGGWGAEGGSSSAVSATPVNSSELGDSSGTAAVILEAVAVAPHSPPVRRQGSRVRQPVQKYDDGG